MLKSRVVSGVLLAVCFVALVLFLPPGGLCTLTLTVAVMGAWEFYRLLDKGNIPHFKKTGFAGILILMGGTWIGSSRHALSGTDVECGLFAGIVIALFVRSFSRKLHARSLEALGATLLGIIYVGVSLNFFVKIIGWTPEEDGRVLALYLIFVVKSGDIGAYFLGCAFGKRKICPHISPAKTWVGCGGGILTGLLMSLGWLWVTGGRLGVVQLNGWDALFLGCLLPIVGIIGDLAESIIKRTVGAKDSGTWIKGMGGVLDMIDSVLFAAPVVYLYARLFWE